MATAFDHMAPRQRLNYWLHQRVGELNEQIRLLTSEKKMWDDAEVRRACTTHYNHVVAIRKIDVDTEIQNLSIERRSWEGILKDMANCLNCSGYGKITEVIAQDESRTYTCSECNGTGKVQGA